MLTTAALSSVGADVVLVSVEATRSEIGAITRGQRLDLVVHDDEFEERFPPGLEVRRLVPHHEDPDRPGALERTGSGPRPSLRLARRPGSHFTLLSSGTTGSPKGTTRRVPRSLEPLTALVERMPLRVRDVTLLASPLFHAWGFGNLGLAMALSSTVVLQRRFEPEAALAAVAQHRVRVMVAVPVMLQRLVELPEAVRRRYDASSLEIVATSGSALPGDLATRFMDRFGDILYNVYGSTEAGWASIATPGDLRIDPKTAGRPAHVGSVTILDPSGRTRSAGQVGRIVVAGALAGALRGRVPPTTSTAGPWPPGTSAASTAPVSSSSTAGRTTWSSRAARTCTPRRSRTSLPSTRRSSRRRSPASPTRASGSACEPSSSSAKVGRHRG